ncbi:MAG: hypothetical protein WDA75_10480 [Candidatus Latescibacterota bacterium]|jgi:hypothetical protein
MDYVTSAITVLGILSALVAVRLVARVLGRHPASGRFLKALLPFALPPLITGGPGLIGVSVFLCSLRDPSVPSYLALLGLAGGVMLAIGLTVMLGMLTRQQREILGLQKRAAGGHGDVA